MFSYGPTHFLLPAKKRLSAQQRQEAKLRSVTKSEKQTVNKNFVHVYQLMSKLETGSCLAFIA